MPEFRNRPEQYPAIGALGRTLKKVDDFARKPFGYDNPPVAMISDFLDIPGVYKTAENINYGSPLTRGTGQARQMTDDTKAGLFGAMNFAPGVAALARATKGMPVGLTVKPVGNLNFRHSVIAESLKGPEKQKISDFVKQIKGMKGLTKEGKRNALEILENSMDQNTVVTKQFIEDSFKPSQYNKVDLAGAAEDAEFHMDIEAAERAMRDPERFHMLADELGLEYDDPNIAGELEKLYDKVKIHQLERGGVGDSERFLRNVSPTVRDALTNSGLIGNGHFDHRGFTNAVDEVTTALADTHLEFLRENHVPTTDYQYREYQRLVPDIEVGNYVEMGISHPDAPSLYGHYSGSPEPLVAHFRGTGNPKEIRLPTDYLDSYSVNQYSVKPNSFVIEELQSDAQKGVKQEGSLHQAHATAFKAAVQHALEQGHNTVYLPSADTIGFARGKSGEPFASIYDQEVVNYGLAPLSRMEGVEVTPIVSPDSGRGVAYHELNFSPEAAKEILEGKGQAFPGFAVGGAVGMKEGGKPERTEDRQSFKATPRLGTLGKIADATKYLHNNYLKAQAGYDNPVTEAISNLAGIPAFAEMMDRLSYGDSMFKGKGETLKLQDWAVDGLSSVPAGVAANLGVKVVKSIPGALKHGATSFAKASAGTASNVVRPKGSQNVDLGMQIDFNDIISRPNAGNARARLARWEDMLASGETREYQGATEELSDLTSRLKNDLAVDDWIRGTLAKYMKRDMGTPEDPVRALAEQGITHTNLGRQYETPSVFTAHTRNFRGYPEEGMASSPEAKRWETVADDALGESYTIGGNNFFNPFTLRQQDVPEWYINLPEGTEVFEPRMHNLGFDHIVDVLHEDLATGRLRPEQVSKISMSDAVRRTHQYDLELAARMEAAKAAQRAGLPVHKEYGTGFKWIELNKPGSFASESDAMGHSVRGYEPPRGHEDWVEESAGYGHSSYGHGGWDAIKSGKAKVHSLVDEKGNPHVTVESYTPDIRVWDDVTRLVGANKAEELHKGFQGWLRTQPPYGGDAVRALNDYLVSSGIDPMQNRRITQIKGKQNTAPADDYQPYIADFVRTGDFHPRVGDAHHTDMIEIGGKLIRRPELQEIADQVGFDLGYAEGLGGRNYFNNMSRKDPNILSGSDKMMLDAIKTYQPPELKDGGSVDLRQHYLGIPTEQDNSHLRAHYLGL